MSRKKAWRGFSQIKGARQASEDHLLMKYAKAHKETLRPLRKAGGGGGDGAGLAGQEARQIHRVSRKQEQAKALSIRISRDVNWREKRRRKERRGGGMDHFINDGAFTAEIIAGGGGAVKATCEKAERGGFGVGARPICIPAATGLAGSTDRCRSERGAGGGRLHLLARTNLEKP